MDKKILVLGGNAETANFVKFLKNAGFYAIVVDPQPRTLAKSLANESYDLDCLNLPALTNLAKKVNPDAIIVGVADILVESYFRVCGNLGYPCYATEEATKAFKNKNNFISICDTFSITTTPRFDIEDISQIKENDFPLLVKPIDNGAGVGMSKCTNFDELNKGVSHAKMHSLKKSILIERYMDCDDMFAYFTFLNGQFYLTATADRHKTSKTSAGSPVCIGATYPSKYHDRFIDQVLPKLNDMFSHLNLKCGVLNIQFFVENEMFYAYDPGFRLQGEAPHIHIKHDLGFDQRRLLVDFALSNDLSLYEKFLTNNYVGKNSFCCTVWVLLKSGKIANIEGMEELKSLDSFLEVIQRLHAGDTVEADMIDTERQTFARFYLRNTLKSKLYADILILKDSLKISDEKNNNLIFDIFTGE